MRTTKVGSALVVLVVLAAVGIWVGVGFRNDSALRHLMTDFGYKGNPSHFPGAYFTSRIKDGMSYRQTLAALEGTGYRRVEYYALLSPQRGDTMVVQRLVYELPWARDIHANVVFDGARVVDIEMSDAYLRGLQPIGQQEAERRLDAGEH